MAREREESLLKTSVRRLDEIGLLIQYVRNIARRKRK
jgi:hypothetical protein